MVEESWEETRDREKTTGTNGDDKLEQHKEHKDERSRDLKETEDTSGGGHGDHRHPAPMENTLETHHPPQDWDIKFIEASQSSPIVCPS